jgi:hypothetical protein
MEPYRLEQTTPEMAEPDYYSDSRAAERLTTGV